MSKQENKKIDYKKIRSRRYHYMVFFPESTPLMVVEFLNQLKFIRPTTHAKEEMLKEKHGSIPLPSKEDIMNQDNSLIEFYEPIINGKQSGYIQKMLVRVKHLSDTHDYSYLIAREGYIVSAWANTKSDIHRLKNSNSYFEPKENKKITA